MDKEAEIKSKQGSRLKEILEEHGIRQKELAKKIVVSEQTVTKWVTGKVRIPQDRVDQILELFPTPPLEKYEDKVGDNLEAFIEAAKYSKDWLLGKSDYKNLAQKTFDSLKTSAQKNQMYKDGLDLILKSMGYSFSGTEKNLVEYTEELGKTNSQEEQDALFDEFLSVLLSSENNSHTLTFEEYINFTEEIKDFIEFKISRIMNRR